ncbi:unnamed protein product [Schistosoma margrebowiei]|uniref:Uncharacterized protein n=1 Tax=Schistosoma margrebowiei TaxID=48269 RepID=A0A183N2S0_9TREM|nr:unnamed protein product [Schistosoma margrebowiei]
MDLYNTAKKTKYFILTAAFLLLCLSTLGSCYNVSAERFRSWPVFGSSYISDDYLIPLVNLESLDEHKKSFELELVNPLSYSVKVDNLRVFPGELLTDYCSYSQGTSNSTSINDLIDNYAFEPIILHSYDKKSLLKATIDADDVKLIQISSSLWEFDHRKPDQIFYEGSTNDMGFLSPANKFSKLPAALISINEFPNQVLYSRVSLLYLGVMNSPSDSISKPIEVLFLGNQPLEVTSIEANIYDEALSINITEKIIEPHTTIPKTIGIVTLSTAHLSYSYHLSGIITVFTNDKSIYLRIPFFGRLIHGSLTSGVQIVPNYKNENNQQDLPFLFRFMLTNQYDFTLFIWKIDFLTPSHKYLLQVSEYG